MRLIESKSSHALELEWINIDACHEWSIGRHPSSSKVCPISDIYKLEYTIGHEVNHLFTFKGQERAQVALSLIAAAPANSFCYLKDLAKASELFTHDVTVTHGRKMGTVRVTPFNVNRYQTQRGAMLMGTGPVKYPECPDIPPEAVTDAVMEYLDAVESDLQCKLHMYISPFSAIKSGKLF